MSSNRKFVVFGKGDDGLVCHFTVAAPGEAKALHLAAALSGSNALHGQTIEPLAAFEPSYLRHLANRADTTRLDEVFSWRDPEELREEALDLGPLSFFLSLCAQLDVRKLLDDFYLLKHHNDNPGHLFGEALKDCQELLAGIAQQQAASPARKEGAL